MNISEYIKIQQRFAAIEEQIRLLDQLVSDLTTKIARHNQSKTKPTPESSVGGHA
jgi:hypothetical protein